MQMGQSRACSTLFRQEECYHSIVCAVAEQSADNLVGIPSGQRARDVGGHIFATRQTVSISEARTLPIDLPTWVHPPVGGGAVDEP